jgi:parallel beta-helix repeat protein
VQGFTIINGYAADDGGGISCENSSPTISDNIISGNEAHGPIDTGKGGGIYCYDSSPIITGNTISGNECDLAGGGIACWSSSPTITGNTIMGHYTSWGGGIYCKYSSPTIIGNTITGNHTQQGGGILCHVSSPTIESNTISVNSANTGGGISCSESSPIITGNTITGNMASISGGGIRIFESNPPTITGNAITGNTAVERGGGIYCSNPVSPFDANITNCILWNNSPDEIFVYDGDPPDVTYSNVQAGWPGEGNIDTDPLFRDSATGDFHLMAITCGDSTDSPCIDAGCPDSIDVIRDCDHGLGTARCDMGAYGGNNSAWPVGTGRDRSKGSTLPKTVSLFQNYPNPFNPTTTIAFDIPGTQGVVQQVQLTVYNIRGKQVIKLIDSEYEPGSHRIVWDGRNEKGEQISSGIYLYTLRSGENVYTRKMVLLK